MSKKGYQLKDYHILNDYLTFYVLTNNKDVSSDGDQSALIKTIDIVRACRDIPGLDKFILAYAEIIKDVKARHDDD